MSTYALNHIHGGTTDQGLTQKELPTEVTLAFCKSAMILASADGEFSDSESNEFHLMMAAFGVPEAVVAELDGFNPVGKDIEDYLPHEHRGMARHFIYDAIKISQVDGYDDRERAAIHAAGASIGVSESVVIAIEGLITVESALRDARLALLRGQED
jgi:tellurite resistance protein